MRDSFVMTRGAYDKPGEKVSRATPAFLPPLGTPEGQVPLSDLPLEQFLEPATKRQVLARLLRNLVRDPEFGPLVAPIVSDEAPGGRA